MALIRAVCRPADQHETPVAIAAIDIAMLVDFEEHARMAERRAAGNVAGPVAGDAAAGNASELGRCDHDCADSKGVGPRQYPDERHPSVGFERSRGARSNAWFTFLDFARNERGGGVFAQSPLSRTP